MCEGVAWEQDSWRSSTWTQKWCTSWTPCSAQTSVLRSPDSSLWTSCSTHPGLETLHMTCTLRFVPTRSPHELLMLSDSYTYILLSSSPKGDRVCSCHLDPKCWAGSEGSEWSTRYEVSAGDGGDLPLSLLASARGDETGSWGGDSVKETRGHWGHAGHVYGFLFSDDRAGDRCLVLSEVTGGGGTGCRCRWSSWQPSSQVGHRKPLSVRLVRWAFRK